MTKKPDPRLKEAIEALNHGDLERAQSWAAGVLRNNPHHVGALSIIGFVNHRRGRISEALAAYRKANYIAPDQPETLNAIGSLLLETGDFSGAKAAFSTAVLIAPQFAEAYSNLGAVLILLGAREKARECFATAISIEPPSPIALAKAARFFEQTHELEKARRCAELALQVDSSNAIALIALAEIDARAGDYAAVIRTLGPVVEKGRVGPRNSANMHAQLARAFEKTGQYKNAFQEFAAANDIQRQISTESIREEQNPLTPTSLSRLIKFFSMEDMSTWSSHEAPSGSAPIFLLGFPRSGTTLLDQILSCHPDIAVLEEVELLTDSWIDFVLPECGFDKLRMLTAGQLNHYRDAYWRRAQPHLEKSSSKKRVVDKLPLNTAFLGIIYRIFPDAKVIFALRDPRDVVLSCFQQNFAMNAAMYEFTNLKAAAAYYDQVMTLGKTCRERLALSVHEVRYENVINDLNTEISALLSFLGIEWSDSMESYFDSAMQKTIRTPSAKQVIQRPYKSSIGKWRHYELQMQSVLPTLNKWVKVFGYQSSET